MSAGLGKLHLLVGVLGIVLFLATGQMMGFNDPPVPQLPMGERMLFRSRHLYLLFIALINLLVGLRYVLPAARARRLAALAGSALVLLAAALLAAAFFVEASAGAGPGVLSSFGAYLTLAGVVVFALATGGAPARASP